MWSGGRVLPALRPRFAVGGTLRLLSPLVTPWPACPFARPLLERFGLEPDVVPEAHMRDLVSARLSEDPRLRDRQQRRSLVGGQQRTHAALQSGGWSASIGGA